MHSLWWLTCCLHRRCRATVFWTLTGLPGMDGRRVCRCHDFLELRGHPSAYRHGRDFYLLMCFAIRHQIFLVLRRVALWWLHRAANAALGEATGATWRATDGKLVYL
jgi:hypothetical protein